MHLFLLLYQGYGSDEDILYRSHSESTLYSSQGDAVVTSVKHPPQPLNRHIHLKQPMTASTMRTKKMKNGVPPYFFYAPPGHTRGRYSSALNSSNYYMGTVGSSGSIRDVWGRQRPISSR